MAQYGYDAMFANRTQAGIQLADKLDRLLSQNTSLNKATDVIVVGLPRGGVPVALEVARKFGCPLDLIVAKKLCYPGQPEYAIGAVSSDGIMVLSPDIPDAPGWRKYIAEQHKELLQKTVNLEEESYTNAGLRRSDFTNKIVIVVDDGIATGMTALAAIESAGKRGAAKIILAAPVISAASYKELSEHCDYVVAVHVPDRFMSVGQYYSDFTQTSNEEVVGALKEASTLIHSHSPEADTQAYPQTR